MIASTNVLDADLAFCNNNNANIVASIDENGQLLAASSRNSSAHG